MQSIAKQGQVGQEGAPCGLSNECVTDQPTDQQTDTASYRGALLHLKMKMSEEINVIKDLLEPGF